MQPPQPRVVHLRPRKAWAAEELIDKFGMPRQVSLPVNVVDGLQRSGMLAISTDRYRLEYSGTLYARDADALYRLIALARANASGSDVRVFDRTYERLRQITPYFA